MDNIWVGSPSWGDRLKVKKEKGKNYDCIRNGFRSSSCIGSRDWCNQQQVGITDTVKFLNC